MTHFFTELVALGEDRFLTWGTGANAAPIGGTATRPLPPERARQVLRVAFRQDRDVRTRLLALHMRHGSSSLASASVAVHARDYERALLWALAALEQIGARSTARLHVLERERPRIDADFVPVGLPPAKPPESVVPDKLSYLEFEVLDQHRDPHAGAEYRVTAPDGEERGGKLGSAGYFFLGDIPPGNHEVVFPKIEQPPKLEEADFFDIEMVSSTGAPMRGLAYVAKLADGSVRQGVLDDHGRAHLSPVPPGDTELTFPALEAAKLERS